MKLRLRKAIIKEQVTNSEYLVEDIFNKEIIRMGITGKKRMYYIILNVGDEVYVTVASIEPNKGRLTAGRDFKENKELYRQKIALDTRQID